MSKYTAEQIATKASQLATDEEYPDKHAAEMLSAYAALLRERESAKAGVTEVQKLERWGKAPAGSNYLLQPMDDGYWTPWHVAQQALEAVTPMLASAQTPSSLDEAFDVLEHWSRRGNTLSDDDVERFRAIADRIAPMLASAPLTETYVQKVPDKCDRIIWRNSYYSLSILASARVPDGWLPVESAPNDGTMHVRGLMVHGNDESPLYWDACAGHIDTEDGRFIDQGGDDFGWFAEDFTHWHPLAAAPKRGEG